MTKTLLIMIVSCVILVSLPNLAMSIFIQFDLTDVQNVWKVFVGEAYD
jgi:hypothetical protein